MRTRNTARSLGRWIRPRSAQDEGGQVALVLVLGIVMIMVLGASVFVTSTTQSLPVVSDNIAQHDAYRAVEAGLNEYLYLINVDPVRVLCNSSNGGSTAACGSSTGFNMKFEQWNKVPGSGKGNTPQEWFAIHDPTFDQVHGLLDVTFDGAVKQGPRFQYSSATVAFKQANNFLTNAWWSVHGIFDPSIMGDTRSCTVDTGKLLNLSWGTGSNGAQPYSSGCLDNNLAYNPPGTWFNGPMFSDDPLFVCSFGQSGTTYVGNPGEPINTADPYANPNGPVDSSGGIEQGPWTSYGCGNSTPAPVYSKETVHSIVLPPTNVVGAAALTKVAKTDGCLYSGPTQIVFDGSSGIIVSSPETPTTTGSNGQLVDTNNASGNNNTCLPPTSSPGSPIPLPANGVIFVQAAAGNCKNHTNPLQRGYFGSTNTGGCEGDALVGDKNYDPTDSSNNIGLSGALTIGASNDIVAMNSITYQDCGSTPPGNPNAGNPNSSNPTPTTQSQLCPIHTAPGSKNDILGLIAANFDEVNHPVVQGLGNSKNEPTCGTGGAFSVTESGGISDVLCDLQTPRLDAVMLALQHSFTVNNFQVGQQLGVLNVNGVIAEYFVDIDGTAPGTGCSGDAVCTGYDYLQYNWDNRLNLIAPPYYLTPGTPSWTVAAFASKGQCSSKCLGPPS